MFQVLKTKIFNLALLAAILILPAISFAQNPVSWSLESTAKGKTADTVETFKVKLKANIEGDWHLYAVEQPEGGPFPTKISATESVPFQIAGNITSPAPITKFDPNFQIDTKFFAKQAEFNFSVKFIATGSVDDFAVNVKYQVCNDTLCLPPKTVKVSFNGYEDAKRNAPQAATGNQSASADSNLQIPESKTESRIANQKSPIENPSELPLSKFIWLAITLGALSLLTPCVFPMIPITVSYFTNHSAGSRSKAVRLALVYSLGIIGTFTILGMLLAVFVGAAGINLFAANPYVNLLITAIFLFFAFNLFGAYEITVPTGILTKLDNLTRSKEGEGSGIVGALLMGLTFTMTSFTCTSPFVGTILVSASKGDWQTPLVGMLAYSTVFALPFFLLALLPQYVSSLPRAGGWMNSIKVAMGFLEIAAAMKFISNVDLIWKWGIFTRSFVLAIWIAVGAILAVYLLGKFQLPHDSKPERIGAIRLASAILSLSISLYLLTGLFGARLGTLESFLPPETETSRNFFNKSSDAGALDWKKYENDYDGALLKAKAENKLVFVDFTGYTCTNCRWMEANVFTKTEVESELGKFVLARLYTDDGSENNDKHQALEQTAFGTVALPFYAVVDAGGKTVATFPGLTGNAQEFVDFLEKAKEN